MTYNASDTKHIRRQVKVARAIEERDASVLARIVSDPQGRAWMHDLLESCHLFLSTYTNDALGMAFAEGERNIGLQLFLGVVQHCPEQYLQMMREAYDRRSTSRPIGSGTDPGRDAGQPIDSAGDSADYDPYAAAD